MAIRGFADLHCHPTMFMAFGGEDDNSIFWGKPVGPISCCDGDRHNNHHHFPIGQNVGPMVLTMLNNMSGGHHGPSGPGSFANWPSARDILHQQIHEHWLRRAYEGGLRLILACVSDNLSFARLWTQDEYSSDEEAKCAFERTSAEKQLTYIRDVFVPHNSSWMQIAKSASEAEQIIESGKLAVVLSVEMDSLSVRDYLALQNQFHIAHVVPTHLVNSRFGGCAVFEGLFNSANHIQNGEYFEVEHDDQIEYTLEGTLALLNLPHYTIPNTDPLELKKQTKNPSPPNSGHRNAVGILDPNGGNNSRAAQLRQLMRAGLVIDLAHMSRKSQSDALQIAKDAHYPLINTHSDITYDRSPTEREFPLDLAQKMFDQGGMLGLGVSGDSRRVLKNEAANANVFWVHPREDPKKAVKVDYSLAQDNRVGRMKSTLRKEWHVNTTVLPLTGTIDSISWKLNQGKDKLPSNQRVWLRAVLSDGERYVDLQGSHNGDALTGTKEVDWPANSLQALFLEVPQDSHDVDIVDLEISLQSGSETFMFMQQADGDGPVIRLGNEHEQTSQLLWVSMGSSEANEEIFERLLVTVETKGDDLKADSEVKFCVLIDDEWTDWISLNKGLSLPTPGPFAPLLAPSRCTVIPAVRNVQRRQIQAIKFVGSFASGDNWSMNEVRVQLASDPVAHWVNTAKRLLEVNPSAGIAFGTDFNGLAAQMSFAAPGPNGQTFATPNEPNIKMIVDGDLSTGLGPLTPDSEHTWTLSEHGLAHMGMLANLAYAIYERDPDVGKQLFGSAQAFIDLWKACETAAPNVHTGG